MLSCGKEYVKLAWEFICKPGRENLDFLQVKKREMMGKTKNIVFIEVLCILERHCQKKGGSIRFSDIQKYLT
jgi:hypothetical protein